MAQACLGVALVLAVVAAAPSSARADGDPASDVLASQPLFLPADGGIAQPQATQLRGLLASAQRAGVPIRVAVIATQADLGSVTELWRQPQSYAAFLGQELSQVYRGTLVVVMPAGVGVTSVGRASGAGAQVQVGAHGGLVATAISVVQAVAGAQGHHLRPPPAVIPAGSGSWLGSVDLGSWLALAAGAVLIVAAWAASLRARPLSRLREAP